MQRSHKLAFFIIIPLAVIATGYAVAQHLLLPEHTPTPPITEQTLKVDIVAEGLNHPWAVAALPDGRFLITERSGNLRFVSSDGSVSKPLTSAPEVYHAGQGGLLDVVLHPDFATNHTIYFSYAEAKSGKAGAAVATATLTDSGLNDVSVIFRQQPKVEGDNHFGSRLEFAPDGTLFVGLGERFDYMDQAQKLDNHLGKIVRITKKGDVPQDNPFINTPNALPEIWSYGHRNIQGAAMHPNTGKLWIHEHGPKGGDEINTPEAGKNYGWPKASYGIHYWMVPIEDDHVGQGFEEPIHHWTPSIAPSGMTFYTGDIFPEWKGNLFIGALAKKHLARLVIEDNRIMHEERLLADKGWRIRDVMQGVDGALYVLTDEENGKVVKLSPAAN